MYKSYLSKGKQKKFIPNVSSNSKNFLTMMGIILLTLIALSMIVLIDKNGFENISSLWSINKKIIFIIAISSFGLGISSFLIQQSSNNKLADSSVLGIGNINLVVLMILIFILDFNSSYSISNYKYALPYAFTGFSILGSLAIYWLSSRKNIKFSKKFILIGIMFNYIFVAISYSVNSFLPSGKQAIVKQYTNGFYDSSEDFYIINAVIIFAIAIIWLMFILEKFKIVSVNRELAQELGINANSINCQAIVLTGIFMASSFILVGNVAFLGLIAGNMSSFVFKKNYKYAAPSSGYLAIIIVAITFFLNKNIAESNINTSQLIPLISLPYFLYLIIRS